MTAPTPTLRQLRYFEAVARHGHFGRAAEACAISQPALSVQIRELEALLGTALFERTGRAVRLTDFGRDFLPHARAILRQVEELGEMARARSRRFLGRLRLGVIPTIGPYLLPRLVTALREALPELDLAVRESRTDMLVAELEEGRLDAAILALPIASARLAERPLFREPFLLVRHESCANEPVPRADELPAMRLLLLEEGHCFRDQALSFCGLTPAAQRETLDASSLSTLVQMVGAGFGVTLLPEMAVPVETRAAPVITSRLPPPEPERTIGMIWRRTDPRADRLERIADLVARTCATHRQEDAAGMPS